MFTKIYLLIIFLVQYLDCSKEYHGYRFKLDIGNPNVYCPSTDYKCPNGEMHYVCKRSNVSNPRCVNYHQIQLSMSYKKTFLQGTNGIRNKIATDLGISNMNILYWSDEISAMAGRFLRECIRDYDPCQILGENHVKLCQNIAFFKGQVTDRLPGRLVRHWYLELGMEVKNWRDYKKKHHHGKLENLTNMIYPLAEFVGCSGARMFDGYFLTCYYHPPYNRSNGFREFSNGRPCTNCSKVRETCSTTFTGLCGVDFEINGYPLFSLNLCLLMGTILIFLFRTTII